MNQYLTNLMKGSAKKSISEIISTYFLYFVLYSVFGWCYETFLEVVIYKWGFSPREYLVGPYCPIYGFGALAFLFIVYPMVKNKPFKERLKYIIPVFLACMILATAVELASSYISEWFTGSWSWKSYLRYKYNFQGRIALSPALRFGLGGVLFLYALQPAFETIAGKTGKRITVVSGIMAVLMIADLIWTIIK